MEVIARHHLLEGRIGVGPIVRSWKFPNPTLRLEYRTDSNGDEHYSLFVESQGNKRPLTSSMNNVMKPLAIGRWLADQLGSELELAPEIEKELAA